MRWLQKISQLEEPVITRPIRIMVFQGSARNANNCPGQDGKTKTVTKYAISNLPENIEIDYCDLSVDSEQPIVQPCRACISSAGGYHCHWQCDCYSKGDKDRPDFMHENDVYTRLEKCDGFALFAPVNWYSVPTQVKAMFDRLVCASLTLTAEDAIKLTDDDVKNLGKTKALERSGKYDHLLKNHLAGRMAAFFVHGDNGADDYREYAKTPQSRQTKPSEPSTYTNHKDARYDMVNAASSAVMPLVCQCRYSGIEVPDDLIIGAHINEGYSYSVGNERYLKMKDFFKEARSIIKRLAWHINKRKGFQMNHST